MTGQLDRHQEAPSRRFSVAPMMDGTDRHCRYFHRLLTKRARLYTEMITADALIHGPRARLLRFDAAEHPVAIQLGGSDPAKLALAARMAEDAGYDEVNLNVGCPSDRVQSGAFGACLMREPDRVAACVAAMREAVAIEVTVKSRIGVDDQDPEEALFDFVDKAAAAGCATFIVHARKAWLKGLSPKENRDVPPLDYGVVYRLKAQRARLTVIINGGVETIEACAEHLRRVDGVMLGRAAYGDPFLLADVDRALFGDDASSPDREAVVAAMSGYLRAAHNDGVPPMAIARHMLGLYKGAPGARAWRRFLSENGPRGGADLLDRALEEIRARAPAPLPA